MVGAILDMAHALGLIVVAGGIDTEEQAIAAPVSPARAAPS
jgi:sensor c-di-GMP phosphodiesterase-like protein